MYTQPTFAGDEWRHRCGEPNKKRAGRCRQVKKHGYLYCVRHIEAHIKAGVPEPELRSTHYLNPVGPATDLFASAFDLTNTPSRAPSVPL